MVEALQEEAKKVCRLIFSPRNRSSATEATCQLSESIQQGVFHPLRELDETESLEGDQEVKLPIETAEISFEA